MTPDEFRKIALSFPDTEERSHMNHPDFRVGGKIFASLGPDITWGMTQLTPEQQAELIRDHPEYIKPAAGKWGTGGSTIITLATADTETVGEALTLAYQNIAKKVK